jgi:hypothetical protein
MQACWCGQIDVCGGGRAGKTALQAVRACTTLHLLISGKPKQGQGPAGPVLLQSCLHELNADSWAQRWRKGIGPCSP